MSHRRDDMLPPIVAMRADRQAQRRGMGTHGAGQSAMPAQVAGPCVPVPGPRNSNTMARAGECHTVAAVCYRRSSGVA